MLAGGAVVADRMAVALAERRAVAALESNLALTGSPRVDIRGFPFLTQLARGSLDDVTAQVPGATLEGTALTDVDVRAAGVRTSAPWTVRTVTVAGTLPTVTLDRLLDEQSGLDLTVRLDADRVVLGTRVLGLPVEAVVVPRADAGGLRVDVVTVTLAGAGIDVADLPGGLAGRLSDLVVPVSGLPAGVTVTAVAVVADGARLTATGTDVTFTR